MYQQSTNQIPVTFKDVAACFSEEAWKLLHEREKLFYIGVMQKIHQELITLGYHILNLETLVRVIKYEDVFQRAPKNTNSRTDLQDLASSYDPATDPTPDIFFRIKYEDDQGCGELQSSEEIQIGTVPSTGLLMVSPDFPLQIKEEEEWGSMDSEGRGTLACDPGHQNIHSETLLQVIKSEDSANVDVKDLKGSTDFLETTLFHHPAIRPSSEVVLRVQQEQCSRDAASPKEEKMINIPGIELATKFSQAQARRRAAKTAHAMGSSVPCLLSDTHEEQLDAVEEDGAPFSLAFEKSLQDCALSQGTSQIVGMVQPQTTLNPCGLMVLENHQRQTDDNELDDNSKLAGSEKVETPEAQRTAPQSRRLLTEIFQSHNLHTESQANDFSSLGISLLAGHADPEISTPRLQVVANTTRDLDDIKGSVPRSACCTSTTDMAVQPEGPLTTAMMAEMLQRLQASVDAFHERLPLQKAEAAPRTKTSAACGELHPSPVRRRDIIRAPRRVTGRVLPDITLRPMSAEHLRTLDKRSGQSAGRLARDIFKHHVSYELYTQWCKTSNYDGTDNKSALPQNLRDSILSLVRVMHEGEGDHLVTIRNRLNEFLRMRRRTPWKPARDPLIIAREHVPPSLLGMAVNRSMYERPRAPMHQATPIQPPLQDFSPSIQPYYDYP